MSEAASRPRVDGRPHFVVAADQIGVGRQQRVLADVDAACGKQLAVESDVDAVLELDVAVLARQDRVAADEHAAADRDAAVGVALGVEQTVVVDHHVVSDADLVRMAQHDVLTENDAAAARAEERGIQRLAQREPERAGYVLRQQDDRFVLDQRAQSWPADHQRSSTFVAGRRSPAFEQLILRAWDSSAI